eukprot:jgi/Mesen1/4184/ME000219S03311
MWWCLVLPVPLPLTRMIGAASLASYSDSDSDSASGAASGSGAACAANQVRGAAQHGGAGGRRRGPAGRGEGRVWEVRHSGGRRHCQGARTREAGGGRDHHLRHVPLHLRGRGCSELSE